MNMMAGREREGKRKKRKCCCSKLQVARKARMQKLALFVYVLVPLMLSCISFARSASASASGSEGRQQVNNIMDALIGAGDFSSWLSILTSSGNSSILPVSATLFIPRNTPTVDPPPPDPFLLLYHIVPQRLSFSDLLLLPPLSRLPTLLSSKFISVTDNSKSNFSLDSVPLTHPDLFSTPSLAVHGLHTFLDYSRFADDFVPPPPPSPPPPPFLPIGDAIGTQWNSGAPPGHLLFLLFVCFLLQLLL